MEIGRTRESPVQSVIRISSPVLVVSTEKRSLSKSPAAKSSVGSPHVPESKRRRNALVESTNNIPSNGAFTESSTHKAEPQHELFNNEAWLTGAIIFDLLQTLTASRFLTISVTEITDQFTARGAPQNLPDPPHPPAANATRAILEEHYAETDRYLRELRVLLDTAQKEWHQEQVRLVRPVVDTLSAISLLFDALHTQLCNSALYGELNRLAERDEFLRRYVDDGLAKSQMQRIVWDMLSKYQQGP
ncbi:hypothetical protein B0T25DRAFT_565619 [Lasiosphaeria hispida]|uniref:Uncharacterized protein n=1 Tax=Lasiosphaeria hispida TaxID=260671 RepID=A0AAJ0HSS2_9PEZI|nr:hypothetical protein B0T25DRAFT_565619 [Lasiosphaeria hispida]